MLFFGPFLGSVSKSCMFSSHVEQPLDKAGYSAIFSRNMAADGESRDSKRSPVGNGSLSNGRLQMRPGQGPGYGEHSF